MANIINLGLGGGAASGSSAGSGTGSVALPISLSPVTIGGGGIGFGLSTPLTGTVTATLGLPGTTSTSTGGAALGQGVDLVATTSLLGGAVPALTTVGLVFGSGDPAPTAPLVGLVVTTPVVGATVTVGGSTATSDPTAGHTTDTGGVGVVVTTPILGGTVTVGAGGTPTTGTGGTGGTGGVIVTVGGGWTPTMTPTTTPSGGGDPTGGHASDPGAGGAAVPDAQSAYVNIFRLTSTAEIPAAAQVQLVQLQQQVNTGAITASQAVLKVVDMAAGATAVAETSYQFFSGLTPTADGLTYLVHSPSNPTDLSDSYYTSFNLENRYINFASNLGLHSDYAPQFAQVYGAMTFQDAVATAYDRVVGNAQATAAGIDYKAAVADIVSRQSYFQEVAHERFGGDNQDLSVKLAAVAYIMEEAVRADVGRYGQADQNFLFDLADGHAQHHVDLVGTYGAGAPANLTTS